MFVLDILCGAALWLIETHAIELYCLIEQFFNGSVIPMFDVKSHGFPLEFQRTTKPMSPFICWTHPNGSRLPDQLRKSVTFPNFLSLTFGYAARRQEPSRSSGATGILTVQLTVQLWYVVITVSMVFIGVAAQSLQSNPFPPQTSWTLTHYSDIVSDIPFGSIYGMYIYTSSTAQGGGGSFTLGNL